MKQYCLNCNKVFYPTENNWIGYPQYWGGYWDNEEERYISNNVEIPLENKAQDLNFVKWARQELKDGNKVFYSCSW